MSGLSKRKKAERLALCRAVVQKKMRLGLDLFELHPKNVPEYLVDELFECPAFKFARRAYLVKVVVALFEALYGAEYEEARQKALSARVR